MWRFGLIGSDGLMGNVSGVKGGRLDFMVWVLGWARGIGIGLRLWAGVPKGSSPV